MNYSPIMPAFIQFPAEAAIIGRMLAGYGELEYLLCHCMRDALDGDLNKATRILFRNRGEEHRISMADAILRPYYEQVGLVTEWEFARRAVFWCKGTRNQYAHCHWLNGDERGLFFTNLEKGAKSVSGKVILQFFHIDTPLLEKQEAHFRYAGTSLIYMEAERRFRDGRLRRHIYAAPTGKEPPPRHNLPAQHPIRSVFGDDDSPSEQQREEGAEPTK